VPPSTIFLETLIHEFDTLRYLNPGAEPVEVYALADALAANRSAQTGGPVAGLGDAGPPDA
jgi:predicted dehydrogenase